VGHLHILNQIRKFDSFLEEEFGQNNRDFTIFFENNVYHNVVFEKNCDFNDNVA